MRIKKNKIFAITSSRADYGIQKNLIEELNSDKNLDLNLIITGSHFNKYLGYSFKNINKKNINKIIKIELKEHGDSRENSINTIAQIFFKFKKYIEKYKPNLIIILGDRYEILPFVITAHIFNIRVAHIHGGELSYGSIDDSIRHAITKFSNLHFVSNENYKKRVMQLGEHPRNVFNVGSLALEKIKKQIFLDKKKLEKFFKTKFLRNNILIVIHPITVKIDNTKKNYNKYFITQVLNAISEFEDTKFFISKPNADFGYKSITDEIEKFVAKNKNAVFFDNLGIYKFMSLIKKVDMIIGNSSSGIIEAPSLKTPTINIGDRQKGRIRAVSVIDCKPIKSDIQNKIKYVYSHKFQSKLLNLKNPYYKKDTTKNIIKIIKKLIGEKYSYKAFFDM